MPGPKADVEEISGYIKGVQKKIMGSPDRMDRSLETEGLVRRKQRGVRSARQSRRHVTGQPGTVRRQK